MHHITTQRRIKKQLNYENLFNENNGKVTFGAWYRDAVSIHSHSLYDASLEESQCHCQIEECKEENFLLLFHLIPFEFLGKLSKSMTAVKVYYRCSNFVPIKRFEHRVKLCKALHMGTESS